MLTRPPSGAGRGEGSSRQEEQQGQGAELCHATAAGRTRQEQPATPPAGAEAARGSGRRIVGWTRWIGKQVNLEEGEPAES